MLMNFTAQSLRDKRALQQDPSASDLSSPPPFDDPPLDLDPDLVPVETVVETRPQKNKKGKKRSKNRTNSPQDSDSEETSATTHDSSSDSEQDIPLPPLLSRKTSYELQRERNIARNNLLLEATFGKELEVIQAVTGKGTKGKGKGKGKEKGKEKGNVDERMGEGRTTRSKTKGPATGASNATMIVPPSIGTSAHPVPPADSTSPVQTPLPQPPLTKDHATSRPLSPANKPPTSSEPMLEGDSSLGFESAEGIPADEPLLGAPEWVTEAMEWLQDDALGEEWGLCVRAWWYFEKVVGGFGTGVRV
jgi:hypothetical protein